MSEEILSRLMATIRERRLADAPDSYVATLNRAGLNKILEKVGEEATEVILAAKDGGGEELVGEVADLWFHCMVMLEHMDSNADAVLKCLEQRFGLSGLEEKAARAKTR